jgi:hypothetical protein
MNDYLNHISGKNSETVAKCFGSKFSSRKSIALLADFCFDGTQINTISGDNENNLTIWAMFCLQN